MIDFFRTLFGIRKKRKLLPATARPQIGATIVRRNVKIKVSQPCDPALWDWMLLSGWRVNPMRNDRRVCVSLPRDAIDQLNAAGVDKWAKVHDRLLKSVSKK